MLVEFHRSFSQNRIQILLYHQSFEEEPAGKLPIQLILPGNGSAVKNVVAQRIDDHHCHPMTTTAIP
jgi:hypothetical protein